tara:strand:+ start:1478 stop:2134 length:657 start_codon:yes stop_codon:yes gene_type:complete
MYKHIKRFFDIVFSLLGLFILLIPFVIISIILKLTGEGEVFYLQQRVGFKNKNFKILKFATMIKNSPKIGTGSLTLRNDPRVLPFGKFLRKSKINELPQLINVLIGNMSFVGPRPQMKVDFLAYPKDIQKSIYNVVPGITGIGSIFYRDEEKLISSSTNPILFYKNNIAPKKGRLELWYIKNQSFHIDFILILLTLVVVLHKDSKFTSYFFSRVKLSL